MRLFRMLILLTLFLLFTALSPAAAQDDISWLLNQINCLRQSVGSPPLTMNVALSVAANRQAVNLANDQLTDFHKGLDGSTPMTRAQDAGFTGSVGENVAGGRQVSDAFNWWINSPIHYDNMTNAHWKDIGIGIASGPHGTWYTLVFGAMNWEISQLVAAPCGELGEPPPIGNVQEETTSSGTLVETGRSTASSTLGETDEDDSETEESTDRLPTPVILGLDEQGYIQHEIQSGETPGTIMLSYGYTWDALPTLMAINNMTEADARNLNVGDIFLVPPIDGTFTPAPDQEIEDTTPETETTDEAEGLILVVTDTPDVSSEQILSSLTPTPTFMATASAIPSQGAIALLATETLVPPVTFTATTTPTLNATNTTVPPVAFAASVTPTLPPYTVVPPVGFTPTATPAPPMLVTPDPSGDNTPLLVAVVIGIQVVVIGAATVVGYRWGRRRK